MSRLEEILDDLRDELGRMEISAVIDFNATGRDDDRCVVLVDELGGTRHSQFHTSYDEAPRVIISSGMYDRRPLGFRAQYSRLATAADLEGGDGELG